MPTTCRTSSESEVGSTNICLALQSPPLLNPHVACSRCRVHLGPPLVVTPARSSSFVVRSLPSGAHQPSPPLEPSRSQKRGLSVVQPAVLPLQAPCVPGPASRCSSRRPSSFLATSASAGVGRSLLAPTPSRPLKNAMQVAEPAVLRADRPFSRCSWARLLE
jgi:hypothetical protein